MIVTTDVKAVMDTIRELVAEAPETVYTAPAHMVKSVETDEYGDPIPPSLTCFYVHTDEKTGENVEAGCLIGKALAKLGVPLEIMRMSEGNGAAQVVHEVLKFPQNTNDDIDRLQYFAGYVQRQQDQGVSWSEAMRVSEVVCPMVLV